MLGKKTADHSPSSSAGADGLDPFAGVRIENGRVIVAGMEGPGTGTGGGPDDLIDKDQLRQMFDEGQFHGYVCSLLNAAGDGLDYRSLAVDEQDKTFRKACDRLYSRLVDSVSLDALGGIRRRTLEDIIVFGMGFGPLALGVAKEHLAKKRRPKGVPVTAPAKDEVKKDG
jgi:hypothetical protein